MLDPTYRSNAIPGPAQRQVTKSSTPSLHRPTPFYTVLHRPAALCRLSPGPHAIRCKSPAPPFRGRHGPSLLDRTPVHTRRRQSLQAGIVPGPGSYALTLAAAPADKGVSIRDQAHASLPLLLALLQLAPALCLFLLELDDQRLEVGFCSGGGRVVDWGPAVRVGDKGVGAVLEKQT